MTYNRTEPCPVAEQACREVIWLTQNMLLGELDDMAKAILKIREVNL